MRLLLQRVSEASVTVGGNTVGSIRTGLVILAGMAKSDKESDVDCLSDKVLGLRVFPDSSGKMNLNIVDAGGSLLIVSQFTLYGDCRKGRRPSFDQAAAPEQAQALYNYLVEQKLDTPAKIYFKYEGGSPAGSHKPNTAVPQAWYNKQAGIKKLSTETGAGQWGSSLAFAGALFGIDVTVFQVRVSYDQKPYRRALMETYGARCVASPSTETESGRAILKQHPDSPGSLGIPLSQAVEVAAKDPAVKYSLGSVLNHVLLHQTIVGQEAIEQFALAGDDPDVVIACAGGGSNFAGLAFPFLGLQLRGGRKRRFVAVEPAACPSLTRG